MTKLSFRALGLMSVLCASTAITPPAMAQEQVGDDTLDLDEIFITARKRVESIQEVPLSVTAFSAKELTVRSIENLQDIAAATPGLVYAEAANGFFGVATIRGLTQIDVTAPDRNVAIFYGGLFQFNAAASNLDLVDLERVEVVKGPQSTLYGRNAFAGAINYVPAQAKNEIDASASATIGSDQRYSVKGMINLPLGDTLALRVSGGYDTFDGAWDNNLDPDDNLGGYESVALAWDARFKPNDAFEAGLFGYYEDRNSDITAQYQLANNCSTDAEGGGTAFLFFCGEVPVITDVGADTRAFGNQSENLIIGLDLEYDFGPVVLKSLTGYVRAEVGYLNDFEKGAGYLPTAVATGNPFGAFDFAGFGEIKSFLGLPPSETEDWMTELRLETDLDGPLSGSVGVSYYTHRDEEKAGLVCDGSRIPEGTFPLSTCGFLPGATVGFDEISFDNLFPFQDDVFKDDSWAIFGALEYEITEQFTVGGELRYDMETRQRFEAQDEEGTLREADFNFWSFRFTGSYAPTDDILLFASVARGTISGNFNQTFDRIANAAVPEELQFYGPQNNLTFELGMNSQWLDGKITWNTTLFLSKYKDLVVRATPPEPLIASLAQNVGDATSYGIETQVLWDVVEGLRADVSYGYNDPTFDDGTIDLSIERFTGSGDGQVFTTDVGGNSLGRTSNHTFNAGLSQFGDIGNDLAYLLRADVTYQSKQFTRSVPDQFISGRTIVNARATVTYKENIEFALWARNLFDEEYLTVVTTDAPINGSIFEPVGNLGQRRTFGATVSWNY